MCLNRVVMLIYQVMWKNLLWPCMLAYFCRLYFSEKGFRNMFVSKKSHFSCTHVSFKSNQFIQLSVYVSPGMHVLGLQLASQFLFFFIFFGAFLWKWRRLFCGTVSAHLCLVMYYFYPQFTHKSWLRFGRNLEMF